MSGLSERRNNRKTYKQRFLIVHEGKETEGRYIQHIKKLLTIERTCRVDTYYPKHTSVTSMVQKMQRESGTIQARDYLWILIDRDEKNHMREQFAELAQWEGLRERNHVAISNPRFEYWLLLHVLAHPNAASACDDKYVKNHIPAFTKNLSDCLHLFTLDSVAAAIARAQEEGWPSCLNPDKVGSGVGVLVQQMMKEMRWNN